MTVKLYRYMLGVVFVGFLLFVFVTPQEVINANEICITPPFFFALSFLAWKSGII